MEFLVRKDTAKQKICEIICVGNELLIGRVVNTNATWLAKRLTEIGYLVRRITSVRDDLSEISSAVKEALKRGADWVFTSGGLGPTYDDMTLNGVAKAMRRPLVLNRRAYEMIFEKYKQMYESGLMEKLEITPERRKMAELPRGAIPLKNRVGTAPGVLIKYRGCKIVCLPGVPAELMDIFDNEVVPLLQKSVKPVHRLEATIVSKGIMESALAPAIKDVVSRHPLVYIKSHPKGRESGMSIIELHFTAASMSLDEIKKEIEAAKQELKERIISLGGVVEE